MNEKDFIFEGHRCVAIEETDGCKNCVFDVFGKFGKKNCKSLIDNGEIPSCDYRDREDREEVIFVEV